MIEEVRALLDEYLAWLRDKTSLRQVDNQWVEITTPYLDRHNDYLQIYAKRDDGGYFLTDDGYIIQDLKQAGCNLDSQKRQSLLELTLNGFGVRLNDNALVVHTSEDQFSLRKHNLLQAMLAVNDLFYLVAPLVVSLFFEDVVGWLDLLEIRYTPRVKFTGRSGYDHLFHFVIPKSPKQPERIIQTINRPSRETAQITAFSWFDTKDVRLPDSRAYAFLNDSERSVAVPVLDALKCYDVTPVLWSEREAVREELAN